MTQFSGRQLCAIRRREGLPREGLAVKTGKSLNAIARYERDQAVPDLNTAAAIAAALHIEITELLDGTAAETHDLRQLPGWAQQLINELRAGATRREAVSAA